MSSSNTIFSHHCHHQLQYPHQNIVFSHRAKALVANAGRGANDKGKLVDENMIVLRMRIKELEMGGLPPTMLESWMEWEKKYYPDYNKDM
ncbi:hypothetical protein Tco_1522441 [Tanacetum coccineum]